jgi:hypothetical protein
LARYFPMMSVPCRICQSILVSDVFFWDSGVKNDVSAGLADYDDCVPVDFVDVEICRLEFGGGLISLVALSSFLFIL